MSKVEEYREHQCPLCGTWHVGKHAVCEKCEDEVDDDLDYNYTTDDFNYEVRNGR